MSTILFSIFLLGGLGIAGAILLYVVAKKFYVAEDPRVADVESLLPGANCGACGFNGCHDFAVSCCRATSLVGMNCPGAGSAAMEKIADIVGLKAEVVKPKIAVLKCGGSCSKRLVTADYDGAKSCLLLSSISIGTTGCVYGCLVCGDCVSACRFDAIHIDPETKLPVVSEYKCTGCGECVVHCPRHIIELRNKGPRGLRVWVACSSNDRGKDAIKVCKAACIGCGKCKKQCQHDAITIENNLAYIDYEKCKLCRKCVDECPTGAIQTANFPIKPKNSQSAEK